MASSAFAASLAVARDAECSYAEAADELASRTGQAFGPDSVTAVTWRDIANAHREQAVRYAAQAARLSAP